MSVTKNAKYRERYCTDPDFRALERQKARERERRRWYARSGRQPPATPTADQDRAARRLRLEACLARLEGLAVEALWWACRETPGTLDAVLAEWKWLRAAPEG